MVHKGFCDIFFRASTSDASTEKESIPLMDYVLNVVSLRLVGMFIHRTFWTASRATKSRKTFDTDGVPKFLIEKVKIEKMIIGRRI